MPMPREEKVYLLLILDLNHALAARTPRINWRHRG
jgi:hypothetical protein